MVFFHELTAAIKTGLGWQGFHFPLLMEFSRAQPPIGNLPVASSLRLPQAIQVTLPSRKRAGNRAPVAGNISFYSDIQFRRT